MPLLLEHVLVLPVRAAYYLSAGRRYPGNLCIYTSY